MTEYLAGKKPTEKQLHEWIEFFHANGFIVIHNVLTLGMCASLRKDLDEALTRENSEKSKKIMKRMFEHSQHNLNLFDLEPIVTFAEYLIGGAMELATLWMMELSMPILYILSTITRSSFLQIQMD